MSAHTEQILNQLEQRAVAADMPLDRIDAFIADQLGVPVTALYAYLQVWFAAERFTLDERDRQLAARAGEPS